MKPLTRKILLLTLTFLLLVVSGCASIGPQTVMNDSFDYTGVLAESWKQRMLFNMVRFRYGDTPYFLDVTSVINQYSLETGVNVNGQLSRTGAGDTFAGVGGHGTYTDRPTISYIPLSGEKFARSLMRPLPPSAVMFMIEAGYPVDSVLRVCVQSVNGIRNRFVAQFVAQPADNEFYQVLELLQQIQKAGAVNMRIQKSNEGDTTIMRLRGKSVDKVGESKLQVLKILGIDPTLEEYRVTYGSMNKDNKELAILTRSLLQIINNLASYIEVPEAHVAEKLVNPTIPEVTAAGVPLPQLIRVHSSPLKPKNAFVAVPYQSYWFWIDNRDLRSKGLFSFLMFISSLTETESKDGAPIVTISAGG